MKKSLILLSLLLVGCNSSKQASTTSSSIDTNSNSYDSEVVIDSSFSEVTSSSSLENTASSSQNTSSNASVLTSDVSSSSAILDLITLKEARNLALNLKDAPNEVDVITSSTKVKIQGVILSRQDVVTTKKGYGNRYKLCIADTSDYFYVQINDTQYKIFESKIGQSFSFIGSLSVYCKEPEIILESYEVASPIEIDYDAIAIKYESIAKIHEDEQILPTNCKGIACSSLISFTAKYIGVHDDKVLLFSDGEQLILVHTRDKVKNSLTLNSSYCLYATLNMYYYRPSLEYIAHERIDDINTETLFENAHDITGVDLYKTKMYDKDNAKSNMFYNEYTSLYQYVYHYQGYIDYYIKNGKYYVVLTDTLSTRNTTWTQENARTNKALFVVNDYYYNITETQFVSSSYYENYVNGNKIDIYFSLDLYNTNNYYQIFIL